MMSQSFSKIIIWLWRIILALTALCFFTWLIWQNLVASGYLYITTDFCQNNYSSGELLFGRGRAEFISEFHPIVRVGHSEIDKQNRCFRRLFSEPVYFKVKMPRTFEKVKIKIYYQNKNQSLFQIGLIQKQNLKEGDWKFQLKPLENQVLDQLNWHRITQEGIILWQRRKYFESIKQFVNNLPINQRTAYFYYDLTPAAIKNPDKFFGWNIKTPMQYVDYVIAQYQPPKIIDDLKIAETEFIINPDFVELHTLEFMLSAPDLPENQREIKIYQIEVELEREPLTGENLQIAIKNVIQKITSKFIIKRASEIKN